MNDYIEARFDITPCDEVVTDVLAAVLCDDGFESFLPDENGVTAYIKKDLFNEDNIKQVIADFPMENAIIYKYELIEGQDWNSEWEKNYFKPIVVKDKCVIHSSFHTDIPTVEYDIVIDPKMAFGTGHHATTSLIIEQLLDMDLQGKSVVDMGTGTGILAILANMRGAGQIIAVEIDPVAHANAIENLSINNSNKINLILGDANSISEVGDIDVFIANINRNIITQDLALYARTLKLGSEVLFSGFYESDIPVIMQVAETLGLSYKSHTVKDNWACLRLIK